MRRITHINGVPVRRPFYTYAAVEVTEFIGMRSFICRWLRRLFGY